MKKLVLSLFLFSCSIENQLASIRPGETYIIHSGDYAGIEWTDKNTTKPTQLEMNAALAACQATITAKTTKIDQAALDAINAAKTPDERIDALTKYLGLK